MSIFKSLSTTNKMKKTIFQLIFLMLLFACQNKLKEPAIEKFSLSGKTSGLPDGSVIYFTDVLTNQIFDSVSIYQNAFRIERVFPVSPTSVFLHNKDYSATKSMWVENKPMIFDASATDFNHAKVSGSKIQTEFAAFLEATDTIESEEISKNLTIAFIKTHPDSRVSASMLAGYAPSWGQAAVKELFEGLSEENKASVYGIQTAKFIQLNRDHAIGDKFTDFEMSNPKGQLLKLSQNLGRRATLLEFWASWCGPCRKQNPDLVKTYQKYKAAGFEVFSVSLDFSKSNWEKAIAADHLQWNHVSDLKGRNSTGAIIYGVNAIPDNFLLDKDGKIIAKYVWGEALNEAIERALK